MNGFCEYFTTSLKLKLNNSGPSLFPKVQKCHFLDSLFKGGGGMYKKSHWSIYSNFSAKDK